MLFVEGSRLFFAVFKRFFIVKHCHAAYDSARAWVGDEPGSIIHTCLLYSQRACRI